MKFLSRLNLLPTFLLVVACSNNLSSSTIVTATSPDDDFGIEVQSGIPSTSYGPHSVRVYILRGDQRDLLIRTPLFNDGRSLDASNAEVRFNGDSVEVCLRGAVQADKLITFNAQSKDYSVRDGDCVFSS